MLVNLFSDSFVRFVGGSNLFLGCLQSSSGLLKLSSQTSFVFVRLGLGFLDCFNLFVGFFKQAVEFGFLSSKCLVGCHIGLFHLLAEASNFCFTFLGHLKLCSSGTTSLFQLLIERFQLGLQILSCSFCLRFRFLLILEFFFELLDTSVQFGDLLQQSFHLVLESLDLLILLLDQFVAFYDSVLSVFE